MVIAVSIPLLYLIKQLWLERINYENNAIGFKMMNIIRYLLVRKISKLSYQVKLHIDMGMITNHFVGDTKNIWVCSLIFHYLVITPGAALIFTLILITRLKWLTVLVPVLIFVLFVIMKITSNQIYKVLD